MTEDIEFVYIGRPEKTDMPAIRRWEAPGGHSLWEDLTERDEEFKKRLLHEAVAEFGFGTVLSDLQIACRTLVPSDLNRSIADMMNRKKNLRKYLPYISRGISNAIYLEAERCCENPDKRCLNAWKNNKSKSRLEESLSKCGSTEELYGVFKGRKFVDGIITEFLKDILETMKSTKVRENGS